MAHDRMRAFVVTGPRQSAVIEVPVPRAAPGELLVDVERVGICGTDVELFTGEMAYIRTGHTHFPIRLGHEWAGRVSAVGSGGDENWIGKRVTGDTMLGCGHCEYCLGGRQHVCEQRFEVGIRDGWPGALAEKQVIPTRFAFEIPEHVSLAAAAMVEPGGNSLRAVEATRAGEGKSVLILGPGTIGLLAAQFALARGVRVSLAGTREGSLRLARELGVQHTGSVDEIAQGSERFDAVIDATSLEGAPALAVQLVKPGGRVVLIGISEGTSAIDSRDLVLKDVTAVGILSASPGLRGAIDLYASGAVDPSPLVSEVIGLDGVTDRLEGRRGQGAGPGPKVHVDPRL